MRALGTKSQGDQVFDGEAHLLRLMTGPLAIGQSSRLLPHPGARFLIVPRGSNLRDMEVDDTPSKTACHRGGGAILLSRKLGTREEDRRCTCGALPVPVGLLPGPVPMMRAVPKSLPAVTTAHSRPVPSWEVEMRPPDRSDPDGSVYPQPEQRVP
jgi:hypothetical protein